jgi:hypothetical protein
VLARNIFIEAPADEPPRLWPDMMKLPMDSVATDGSLPALPAGRCPEQPAGGVCLPPWLPA